MSIQRFLFVLFCFFFLCLSNILATTWSQREIDCPICGAKNSFGVIMSWGGYIYNWPSKYEYVYWPETDAHSLYSCEKCCYTSFMNDFRSVPKDKIETVKKQLEEENTLRAKFALYRKVSKANYEETKKEFEKNFGEKFVILEYHSYIQIPMHERVALAERAYKAWKTDDEFWCWFYRIKGYHLAQAERKEEAMSSRKEALSIAEKMLQKKENECKKMEILYISGAMRYFLEDKEGALKDFTTALQSEYQNEKMNPEDVQGLKSYLVDLIKKYIQRIHSDTEK